MTTDTETESQRILAEYQRRERDLPADYYALHHVHNLFMRQEHERLLLKCLRRAGQTPLANRRVLDVGCGQGDWLAVFENFGVARQNLAGLELGKDRAEFAARRLPSSDVRDGNAAQLPWADHSFDVVFQRMMFTSILDATMRRMAAAEMMRATRPDGAIVWVDFFINPRNPHVYCLSRREICELFPGWKATFYRSTLAPPISRRLVRFSWGLVRALEQLRVFNTFYFGFLKRQS